LSFQIKELQNRLTFELAATWLKLPVRIYFLEHQAALIPNRQVKGTFMFMKTVIIRSESDYNTAASRIEILAKANPGTAEAEELKLLVKAIADYHRNQK
jgi:hypothetical protein